MDRIFIRGIALPGSVRGASVKTDDDDFVVFVNTNLCPAAQKRAARHEIRHIRLEHFYNQEPVVINEIEAEGL